MGPKCTVKFNFNYKLVVSCDRKNHWLAQHTCTWKLNLHIPHLEWLNKFVRCHLCCLCRLTSSYPMNALVHYPMHRFILGPKTIISFITGRSRKDPYLPFTEKICAVQTGGGIRKFTSIISSVGGAMEHAWIFSRMAQSLNTNSKTIHYLFQENLASLPHVQLIRKSTSEASQPTNQPTFTPDDITTI